MTGDPARAGPGHQGPGDDHLHKIVFTPSGSRGEVASGTTVLDAARQLGVDLDSVCGGKGVCGRCQVVPGIGEFPKWGLTARAEHLTAHAELEAQYRGRRPLADGRRLGCALHVHGDVVLDVPAESQIHRPVVRKELDLKDLALDPPIVLRYVTPGAGSDDGAGSVVSRLREDLQRSFGQDRLTVSFLTLSALHEATSSGKDGVTLALRGDQLVAVWPGFVDRVAGVAIDVGSTTIAGHICDLTTGEVLATAGRMNPQIRFGEDLMSRVSYAMMNPGGVQELTGTIREALEELVQELAEASTIPPERVLEFVVVGNPVMHHLLLGIDPTPLGQAPFVLATSDAVTTRASDVGIGGPQAELYVAPCIAGHVGADTAAAILSEAPHRGDAVQLLVDVGTNAEIVLGNRHRLFAASSPTGPAFEGAQISGGQRAATGAIERVRIDRDTLEPRFRIIGCDLWSDEPGFAEASSELQVTGICGSGIIEVVGEMYLSGIMDAQGVIREELAAQTDRLVSRERTYSYLLHRGIQDLLVTQDDIRAIQLAKAALRAGIELLLERSGFAAADEVRLAGAFGAHIDPLYAMVLGLIPDGPVDNVRAVGNAAGSGAVRALLSLEQRRELERVVSRVTKIETATEPRFQELFVAALAFPHLDAPTTHLSTLVELPGAPVVSASRPPRLRERLRAKQSTSARSVSGPSAGKDAR